MSVLLDVQQYTTLEADHRRALQEHHTQLIEQGNCMPYMCSQGQGSRSCHDVLYIVSRDLECLQF